MQELSLLEEELGRREPRLPRSIASVFETDLPTSGLCLGPIHFWLAAT